MYSEPPRVPDSPRLPDPITESTEPEVRPYIPRRTGGPYKRRKVAIDGIEEEITEEIEISTSTDEIRIPYRKIKKKVKIYLIKPLKFNCYIKLNAKETLGKNL